jgi:hypothetical protein
VREIQGKSKTEQQPPNAVAPQALMKSAHTKKHWNSRRAGAGAVTVVAALVLLAARQFGWIGTGTSAPQSPSAPRTASSAPQAPSAGVPQIEAAYRQRTSDIWVQAEGTVIKLLPDDQDGEAHQKLLVRLEGPSRLTVLVAHSLSAAERIPVHEGERLVFRGQYIWTEQGGTVHFTHAPKFQRKDPGGWIEFAGKRYD